jgi:hypothetical protein
VISLRRHLRCLCAWLALFMGLAALAPTVSRAMPMAFDRDGQGSWVEVCSQAGPRWVRVEGPREAPLPVTVNIDHCALCLLSADPHGFAPSEHVPPQVDVARIAPTASDFSSRGRQTANPSWPRAPPSL